MDPVSRTEENLFAAALERPVAEREAWLRRHCGDDDDLRRAVAELLAAHDSQADLVDDGVRLQVTEAEPGDRLGRYVLGTRLGEGGCGVVFRARQEEPVRREVAVKIIKLGMDTRQVIARFETERQVLAMMEHPGIARVYDAGTTPGGRPFFVMELIAGAPITRFCNQRKLSIGERLRLFIDVCHAVQHAHQRGVIHRDLKPSNILVTEVDGRAGPKVIDFGIAKATRHGALERSQLTAHAQRLGTPAYMSPEQLAESGGDVDTRSDVYALGVVLHELLVGATPTIVAGAGRRWGDVRSLSAGLAGESQTQRAAVAASRGTVPEKLARTLRGDLDWVTRRCLQTDREQRYESASRLAADLECVLVNRPVEARPPSLAYLFRKAFQRHRAAILAAAAAVVLLVAASAVSSWLALRAKRAEQLAETRLTAELSARREAEQQRQLAVERLAAEQAARQEGERQRAAAEVERNRARQAEALSATRLDAELVARRDAELQRQEAETQSAIAAAERDRARAERTRALAAERSARNEAARNAEAVKLMREMLAGSGSHVAVVRDPEGLHAVLDAVTVRLHDLPADETAERLRHSLAAVYYDLGNHVTSAALGGRARGAQHVPLAEALRQLGGVLQDLAWTAEAQMILDEAGSVEHRVSLTLGEEGLVP